MPLKLPMWRWMTVGRRWPGGSRRWRSSCGGNCSKYSTRRTYFLWSCYHFRPVTVSRDCLHFMSERVNTPVYRCCKNISLTFDVTHNVMILRLLMGSHSLMPYLTCRTISPWWHSHCAFLLLPGSTSTALNQCLDSLLYSPLGYRERWNILQYLCYTVFHIAPFWRVIMLFFLLPSVILTANCLLLANYVHTHSEFS